MDIELKLGGLTSAQAQAALQAIQMADARDEVREALTTQPESAKAQPEPAKAQPETPKSEPETPKSEPETPKSEPEIVEDSAEAITARLAEKLKEAKTATLKDKARGEPGSEVMLPDGRIGIIHACFRGRCVVEFEDGTAEEVSSPELELRPEEDTSPIDGEAEELEVGDDDDGELTIDSEVTLQVLKETMDTVMADKGRGVAIGLLKKFGVRKLSDLVSAKYGEMHAAMEEALY